VPIHNVMFFGLLTGTWRAYIPVNTIYNGISPICPLT